MKLKFSSTVFCLCLAVLVEASQNFGDCEPKWENQLVWEYEVRRSYPPVNLNEVEASYGPAKVVIKCIKIESLSAEGNESANITSGGLENNYVEIKFRSKPLHKLHYKVLVYARVVDIK